MNASDDRIATDLDEHGSQPRTHREGPTRSYPPPPDPRRKSPGFAALLSIVPGLGQVYVGYYQRGFVHAITAFSIILVLSWDAQSEFLAPLLGPFLAFFWLYNIVDAGRRASLLNFALSGVEPIDLPSDFRAPGFGGSIVGGVVLLVFGGIALAHLQFGVPLEWIQTWWPLAPILFGGWLIAKALRERGQARA